MDNITGKTLGTWEGLMPFGLSDSKIKAKEEIGKGYNTKEEARYTARLNKGAEAIVKGEDGKYHLYAIDDGSSYAFTRDNIEQIKDYPVSNVTTKGSEVKVVSFVTEDDYEVLSPDEHKNPYSGNHYVFNGKNKVSIFIGKDEKEMKKIFNTNTTQGMSRENPPKSVKEALEPSLKILELYDSKAADWLRNLDEGDYLLAGKNIKVLGKKTEIYAAWTTIIREGITPHINDMVLGDRFWELSDVEKASVLYHEYIHAVDDPVIRQIQKLYGTVENLITKVYGDGAEDKAYLSQWEMMKALGVKDGYIYYEVKSYLEERKIGPFKNK